MTHVQSTSDQSNVNTGAVLVVDGWHLEQRGARWSIRDLDLAEHAEMHQPRDIRKVIATAVADGALSDVAVAARDMDSPCFWAVEEVVQMPRGGSKATTVYYLNLAGALLVVSRLKTKKAVEVTAGVMRVFAMVADGRGPQLAPPADPAVASLVSVVADLMVEVRSLRGQVAALASCPAPQMVGRATGDNIRARLRAYAALMAPSKREVSRWRGRPSAAAGEVVDLGDGVATQVGRVSKLYARVDIAKVLATLGLCA